MFFVWEQAIHDSVARVDILALIENAQASGDLAALRDAGREVVRLRLEGDPAAAVRELARGI